MLPGLWNYCGRLKTLLRQIMVMSQNQCAQAVTILHISFAERKAFVR